MKNPIIGALTAAILVPSASANTLLWMDNFNVPDAPSFDAAPLPGRLTGTLADTVFARSSKIQHKIVGMQLQMLIPGGGTGRIRFQNAAGWYDWAAGTSGPAILADGGLRVEFDFTPTNITSSNWISFNVGFLGSAAGEPATRLTDAQTDYGILFRNNGLTQRFDNGVGLGDGGSVTPVLTPRHIVLDYAFNSFADGTNVKVRATESGTQVANDTFTWANNSGALYMELGNRESGSLIDNLSISTLPIVYTLELVGKSVISGAPAGTEIGYLTSETFVNGSESGTYTFAAGAGDADNGKFEIVGDSLRKGTYNFTQDPEGTTYSIRILGTGASGGTMEKTIQLTLKKDDDDDGILDSFEISYTGNLTSLNGTASGPGPGAGTGDLDGDGLSDLVEFNYSIGAFPLLDPTLADTDADGLTDGEEINGSGVRPPTNPTVGDTDKDGLSDLVESNSGTFVGSADSGTNPTMLDTDGDGARDGFEATRGSNPLDFNSRPALPAGFALVRVTDDASTGIDSANTYTHTISGGGPATINGVTLEELNPVLTPPDFTWAPTGVRAEVNPINNRTWVPADGGVTGTGLQQMLGGFAFDGFGEPTGTQTYTLTGLTIGTTYQLKIFIRPWDKATVSRRPIDLTFTNGTIQSQPFGALLEDHPGIVLNNGNDDSAYYLSYTYQAQDTQIIIQAVIPESAIPASGSFHLYGLTNAVVPSGLYQTWAAQFPGFNATGFGQDPDGDGNVNLLEYAFDTNPTNPAIARISYSGGNVTGHGQPLLDTSNPAAYSAVFGRRKDYVAAGLTYKVEFSADLATWTATSATPAVVASDAIVDAVSVPFPASVPSGPGTAAPRFFRVAVNVN